MNTNNDAALQNVLVQGITMGIPDWEFKPKWIRNGRGDQMQLGKIWDKTETLEYVREAQFPAEFIRRLERYGRFPAKTPKPI